MADRKPLTTKELRVLVRYVQQGGSGQTSHYDLLMSSGWVCRTSKAADRVFQRLMRRFEGSIELNILLSMFGMSDLELTKKTFELLHCGDVRVERDILKLVLQMKGKLEPEQSRLGTQIIIHVGEGEKPPERNPRNLPRYEPE